LVEDRSARRGLPQATVGRLPEYLHVLERLVAEGTRSVSSAELAASAGVSPAQLRKDLSQLGSYGVRGVGYDTEHLAGRIAHALGLTRAWPVIIVGIGRLGQALARYPGLTERGFEIAALFDIDPTLVAQPVAGLPIRPMLELPRVVAEKSPVIGVIATPEQAAAGVCRFLADAGVTAILNFAPAVLTEPPGVHLRQVDVANELQILAFHVQTSQAQAAELEMAEGAAEARLVDGGLAQDPAQPQAVPASPTGLAGSAGVGG
jgi:redox-sensing transcriptional repressor